MSADAFVKSLLAMAIAASAALAQAAVTIDTVPIRNAGNTADATGFGRVNYAYNIGEYEVTAGQYTAFLNAVASTVDTYNLYISPMSSEASGCKIQQTPVSGGYVYSVATDYVDRPVNYVNFANACRFANWLHNGQPIGLQGTGTTETGAYTIIDQPGGIATVYARDANWKWAVTSEDEWYKAAYHKNDGATANYFVYPTKSNAPPGRDMADPLGNNANYYPAGAGAYPIDSGTYYTTKVGEFQNSASPYGTFDQGGNVWEWNESIIDSKSGARGGSFPMQVSDALAAFARGNFPGARSDCGFRVVNLPMTFAWSGNDSSSPTNWAAPANWTANTSVTSVPDGPGTQFSFGNQLATKNIVDMGSVGRTVGSLTFTAGTSTTVQSAGGKSLTLNNGGIAATVSVAGSHTISAPVILDSDVNISGTGSLNLSGGVSGAHAVNVLSGSLVAKSIVVDTLSIGSGASVTISETTTGAAEAVPEPCALVLAGMGAIGLLAYAWRRQ